MHTAAKTRPLQALTATRAQCKPPRCWLFFMVVATSNHCGASAVYNKVGRATPFLTSHDGTIVWHPAALRPTSQPIWMRAADAERPSSRTSTGGCGVRPLERTVVHEPVRRTQNRRDLAAAPTRCGATSRSVISVAAPNSTASRRISLLTSRARRLGLEEGCCHLRQVEDGDPVVDWRRALVEPSWRRRHRLQEIRGDDG